MSDVRSTAFLDLFRGVAAIWVVITHCLIWGGAGWLPSPKLAVDLFMILSGFLMVYTIERSPGWKQFAIRRFFRIAPGYYAALAAMIVLSGPVIEGLAYLQTLDPHRWGTGGKYDPRLTEFGLANILWHVSFLFGIDPKHGVATMLPDWSLSLEMQFYAAFPLLYLAIRKTRWAIWAISLPCIGFAMAFGEYYEEPSFLPLKLAIFAVGMLIHDKRFIQASAFLLLASWPLAGEQIALFALVAAMCVLWARPNNVGNSEFARHLSDCSYAAYLLHIFVIALVGAPLMAAGANVVTMTAAVVFVTYVCAWPFHVYVERPGISLGKTINAPTAKSRLAVNR